MKNDKYNISDLLWLCQRAVEDAIYCENFIQVKNGRKEIVFWNEEEWVDVIKEIKKYRKEHKLK